MLSEDPAAMLAFVLGNSPPRPPRPSPPPSDRKLRLFACACARQSWHLLADPRARRAVEVAERFADGLATARELDSARQAADRAYRSSAGLTDAAAGHHDAWASCDPDARVAPRRVGILPKPVSYPAQAALLREVVGNPWRPDRLPLACADCGEPCGRLFGDGIHCARCGSRGRMRCPWLTPTALRIARGIYADRDFAALPVLADVLEEGGCDDAELLRHLRGPGPHARGCWATDLVLGKE